MRQQLTTLSDYDVHITQQAALTEEISSPSTPPTPSSETVQPTAAVRDNPPPSFSDIYPPIPP